MATKTEILIRHQRNRGGILLPLIEDFMREPVNIEDDRDIDWINGLLRKMANREEARSNDAAVFSPSALASCMRQVYLLRHSKGLEIKKSKGLRIEPNFYFLNGNFLHIKWQFVLQKMDWAIGDGTIFELVDVEVPILSKRGDHGGTVDVIIRVNGELMIVDFKGLNVRGFSAFTRGNPEIKYEIQLADYMMLYNAQPANVKSGSRIDRSLLMIENKGGPDPKFPLALFEHPVLLKDKLPEVRARLEILREHEKEKEIPEVECKTTTGFQYKGCPFAAYCKEEIKEIERAKRNAENRNPTEYRVATPGTTGHRRSRGNRRKR